MRVGVASWSSLAICLAQSTLDLAQGFPWWPPFQAKPFKQGAKASLWTQGRWWAPAPPGGQVSTKTAPQVQAADSQVKHTPSHPHPHLHQGDAL